MVRSPPDLLTTTFSPAFPVNADSETRTRAGVPGDAFSFTWGFLDVFCFVSFSLIALFFPVCSCSVSCYPSSKLPPPSLLLQQLQLILRYFISIYVICVRTCMHTCKHCLQFSVTMRAVVSECHVPTVPHDADTAMGFQTSLSC